MEIETMTVLTIPQKQSNTGTIYDLASDQFDREINFGKSFAFAVVLPAYYNVKITRHRTLEAAIKKVHSFDGYMAVTILDRNGEQVIFA